MSESNCTPLSRIRLTDLPSIPLKELFKYLGPKPIDEQDRILDLRRHLLKKGAGND